MHVALREPISRRHVLRGVGAGLALPLLNAMAPRSVLGAPAPKAPLRMGFLYFPNGVHTPKWITRDDAEAAAGRTVGVGELKGDAYQLPPLLEQLEPYRDDFQLLSGLATLQGRPFNEGGAHAPAAGSYLTAAHPKKSVTCGTSVDQLAAQANGHLTRLPSLEIATPRDHNGKQFCDKYPCIVTGTLSWRTPTQPLPVQTSPLAIFNRLFSDGDRDPERLARRGSILDAVREQAKQLSRSVDSEDRHKIEEYLTSVRDIELRMERAKAMPAPKPPPGLAVPPEEAPVTFAESIELLADLMVAAFQTDSTRICTFILAVEGSNRAYPELGGKNEHHHLSHNADKPEMLDEWIRIQKHQFAQLGYLIKRLKAVREGGGTLFDHSMITYGCALGNGAGHDPWDLPIMLAGRGNGTLRPGRHLVYPKHTPLANLWLAKLDRVGVHAKRFGDSTGILQGLA